MKPIVTAFVLASASLLTTAAHAACISETVCDSAGNCQQIQKCEDAVDVVQASPPAMTPIPVAMDPMASETDVIAAASNCEEVEICGTPQLVCK